MYFSVILISVLYTSIYFSDYVEMAVINITARRIGKDWEDLAINLGLRYILDVKTEDSTDEEKMLLCFKRNKNDISWSNLKQQLSKMNKKDILLEISQKTLITQGMSYSLQWIYLQFYIF